MENLKNRFQLLVLESPFENWDNPLVGNAFNKMVNLKKQGYESSYSKGVLPVDTSDFISTHILLCERDRHNSLNPIMGYKTITLEKCHQYNMNFPGLSLVQNAKMPLHTQAVQNIMDRCEQEKKGLAYLGSWTVDPGYRHRKVLKNDLKEAFMAFYRLLYREQNVSEVIIGGTLRFKTDKIFSDLGHQPLSLNEQALPPILVVHLMKEPVLVMHSPAFNEASLIAEKKWQGVWDNRIHVADSFHQETQIRVA